MSEKVINIISAVLGIDKAQITEQSDIMEQLGADSVDVIDIISELEDSLSISIPDEIIPDIRSVKDLTDYLENK